MSAASFFLDIVASWPEPNYANPVTRGNGIVVVSVLFGFLGTIATALRLYTRTVITRTFGLDDGFIIVAWVTSIAMFIVMSLASAQWGWSRHIWDIPFPTVTPMLQASLVYTLLFGIASAFTKLSLLWFCRRIIGDGRKVGINYHNLACTVVMIIVGGFIFCYTIIELVQCIPLKAYWDLLPTYPYHCINGRTFILAASIANTLTDCLTTFIPVTLIARLHLPPRQRIAVISIFALGILVNIAGAFRTFYVHRTMEVTNLDSTWVGWPTAVCSIIEIGLGLIVASAPALRPLVNHFMPRYLDSSSRMLRRRSRNLSSSHNKPVPFSSAISHPEHFRKGSTASDMLYRDCYSIDSAIQPPSSVLSKGKQSFVEISALSGAEADREKEANISTYPFTTQPIPSHKRTKSQSNRLEVNVTRTVILDVNDANTSLHSHPPHPNTADMDIDPEADIDDANLEHGYHHHHHGGAERTRTPSHSQSTKTSRTPSNASSQEHIFGFSVGNVSSNSHVRLGSGGVGNLNSAGAIHGQDNVNGGRASMNTGRPVPDLYKTSWFH